MIPPEVPTRRGMGCWTVGLLSCIGAIALLVAGMAVLFIYIARQPGFRQAMSAGAQIAKCQQNLHDIYQAIERYHQRNNGKYPQDLGELVPRYLAQAGTLKCPADPSGAPISYRYFRPAKDSPETAPLLQCDHHRVMNQSFTLMVLKNGQILNTGSTSQPTEPSGKSGAKPGSAK